MSEGNGHPYSWSAIFNGYDRHAMENCGFPVIPRYLEAETWPDAQIIDAEVVAVWTQERQLSEHIARATKISVVCDTYEQLLEFSDAILLARDDAENHWTFVESALRVGKPIYIDKPAALKVSELDRIYGAAQYPHQVFTCSALRYAKELTIDNSGIEAIGDVRSIIAVTPKSWCKYGIHIIEAVLNNLDTVDKPVSFVPGGLRSDGAASLIVHWQSGIETAFHATGDAQANLKLLVNGSEGTRELTFSRPFASFKAALADFIGGIQTGQVRSPASRNRVAISLVEAGLT